MQTDQRGGMSLHHSPNLERCLTNTLLLSFSDPSRLKVGVYELLGARQRGSVLHQRSCMKEARVKPSSQPSAAEQTHTIPPVDSHILLDRLEQALFK